MTSFTVFLKLYSFTEIFQIFGEIFSTSFSALRFEMVIIDTYDISIQSKCLILTCVRIVYKEVGGSRCGSESIKFE